MISVLILCSSCTSGKRDDTIAYDNNNAEGFEWKHNYNEITITGYHGDSVDLVIPAEIEGKPVTEIMGDRYATTGGAFNGFKSLIFEIFAMDDGSITKWTGLSNMDG